MPIVSNLAVPSIADKHAITSQTNERTVIKVYIGGKELSIN